MAAICKPLPSRPKGKVTQGALDYARKLADGTIPTSEQVAWTARRFLLMANSRDWLYDEELVERIGRFIEELCYPSGEWKTPTFVLLPWQQLLIAGVYGWRSQEEPTHRLVTECMLAVPRKAGKSTFAGILGLVDLLLLGRKEPTILCSAGTKDQADHVYRAAQLIVEGTSGMMDHFRLTASGRRIRCARGGGGSITALSGNVRTMDGHRPTMVIVDEIHSETSPDLLNLHRTSFTSTPDGLLLMPTTAGSTPCSVGLTERQSYLDQLDDEMGEESNFGLLYEAAADDDPGDPATWAKAQPSLGHSVYLSKYRQLYKKAQANEEQMVMFLTRQLNIWTHSGMKNLFPLEDWQALPAIKEDWRDIPRLRKAFIGLDLSLVDDLSSITLLGEVGGKLHAWWEIFVPGKAAAKAEAATLKRSAGGQAQYPTWIRDGHLIRSSKNAIDFDAVADVIEDMCKRHNVRLIGSDTYFTALQELRERLRPGTVGKIAYTPKSERRYTAPTRELQRLVMERELHVRHSPVIDWCFEVCVAEGRVNGGVLPKKGAEHSPDKIDAVDSIIVAIAAREAEKLGARKGDPVPIADCGLLDLGIRKF